MKEKIKSGILSAADRAGFFLKYLSAILKPSIRNISVTLICSLGTYAFYETAEDYFLDKYNLAINLFYALMLTVFLVSVAVDTYRAGKRHLLSPENEAGRFRYFNGLLIGIITAAPFIAFCIVAAAKGLTYYTLDYSIELVKLLLYVYAFRFSQYPTAADFSYMQFMLLSLVPIILCALSYIAPKVVEEIKGRKRRKEEAVK